MRTLMGFALFALCAAACPAMDSRPGPDGSAKLAELRARLDEAMETCARELLRAAADPAERADAAVAVGAIYELGLIAEADPVKAAAYYSLAADLDSAEGNCALGNIYSNGVRSATGEIGRDPVMAAEYYGRAALAGSTKAMLELGKIYSEGTPEIPRDTKRALSHFVNAAAHGDPEAVERLEPVMAQAREWEKQRPGRKANFPTGREALVKPELERAGRRRAAQLEKTASHTYVELNRRIAEYTKR